MSSLSEVTSEFIGRLSVSVWIGRLSEESARAALEAYAAACRKIDRVNTGCVQEAILAEYRHRREGQDLCS